MTTDPIAAISDKVDNLFGLVGEVGTKVDLLNAHLENHVETEAKLAALRAQTCPNLSMIEKFTRDLDALAGIVRTLEKAHTDAKYNRQWFTRASVGQLITTSGAIIAALVLAKLFGL